MSQVSRRVLVLGGVPHSLINFRGPLLQALANQGHVVFAGAAGNAPDVERRLQGMGVAYCPVRLSRAGLNPWHDLGTVLSILRLLMRVRPDVLVSYTIKPVIYGSLVARLCGSTRSSPVWATPCRTTAAATAACEPSPATSIGPRCA
jgi:hypothetical protein